MNNHSKIGCDECMEHDFLRHKHSKQPPICLCDVCGKTFTTYDNMRRHMRAVHTMTKRFPCRCGKVFKRKESLKHHYMSIHLPHINIQAPKDLNRRCTYRHSMNMNCLGECTECILGYILRHKHSKNPPICACDICGKTFIQYSNMMQHKRTIHERTEEYACECGVVFTSKRSLYSHYMGTHLPNINVLAEPPLDACTEEESITKQCTSINIAQYPVLKSLLMKPIMTDDDKYQNKLYSLLSTAMNSHSREMYQ